MNAFKQFAQMSTEIFVRFNEQLAERMTDMKIDSKYTDELLGTVHHVKDKNDFYMETVEFWNDASSEISSNISTASSEKIMESLRQYKEEAQKIYGRKATALESKTADMFTGLEKISQDMTIKFCELGLKDSGNRKSAFEALTKFTENFLELDAGSNSGDYTYFAKAWDEFQAEFLVSIS